MHRNILIEMVCVRVFRTLHLQGMGRTDFSLWYADIQKAAGGKANTLKDQQLSRNDIPIIVDSCIAFITQYGEGTESVHINVFFIQMQICIKYSYKAEIQPWLNYCLELLLYFIYEHIMH